MGDKNKAIKDANKTRKKKGYLDLEEITAPVERLVKVEDATYIANRMLRVLDLSFCPIETSSFEACMQLLQAEPKIPPEPALDLTLLLKGQSEDRLVPTRPVTAAGGVEAATPTEVEAEEKDTDAPLGVPGLAIVY